MYCIYLRKSRLDRELEKTGVKETLKRHKQALLELANRKNLKIDKIYEEVVSGETISDRPEMQNLLQDIYNNKYSGVLVMEIERLARGNTLDQGTVAEAFKLSNTKIITPLKVYDPKNEFDEEFFEFGLFMARREYKAINRRIQAGRLASIKQGKYVANIAPYGYKRKKLENEKGFTLEILENEAKVVKLIFKAYTKGSENKSRMGVSKIANMLNNLGVPARKNKCWSSSTIQGILKNPVYIGKVRWGFRKSVPYVKNGQVNKSRPKSLEYVVSNGMHKPIISEDIFNLTQEILVKNIISPSPRSKTLSNPLAGILICGECGKKMIRRPYKSQEASIICKTKNCINISSKLNIVEDRIFLILNNILKDYTFYDKTNVHNKKYNNILSLNQTSLKNLQKEKNKLNFQLDNLYNLLEEGLYSKEIFKKRQIFLKNKLTEIEDNIKNISLNIEELKIKKNDLKIPKLKNLEDVYNSNNATLKNNLLKEVLEKVVYKKEKNCRWNNDKTDFELVVYPKIQISNY